MRHYRRRSGPGSILDKNADLPAAFRRRGAVSDRPPPGVVQGRGTSTSGRRDSSRGSGPPSASTAKEPCATAVTSNDPAAEVLCELTFLLTLPFDAGVPDRNLVHLWSGHAEASVAGWSNEALLGLTGADQVPSGATGPWLRYEFRRGVSRTRPAPDVGDRVFDDRVSQLLSARQRLRRRLGHLTRVRGGQRVHSVVAATRYFGIGEADEVMSDDGELGPDARAIQELARGSLDMVLRPLGRYLSYLAMSSGQPGRRVLSPADLPAGGVPMLLRFHHPGLPAGGHNAVFYPHLELPALQPMDVRQDEIQTAQRAFFEAMAGNDFASFYELMREAAALEAAGQHAWAVTSAATAVELLCRLALRHAASELGKQDRLPVYDKASFYDVLARRLPEVFGLAVDGGPPGVLGRWHQGGYRTRNRFVHEGITPSPAETVDCLDDAQALSAWIHVTVRRDPRLRRLNEAMFMELDSVDIPGGLVEPE